MLFIVLVGLLLVCMVGIRDAVPLITLITLMTLLMTYSNV
jgi:hypothetical protein